jgi:hypothetical protein
MTNVIQTYTKVELDAIKLLAQNRLDALSAQYASFSIYGLSTVPCDDMYKLYMYLWALSFWNQYENGSTVGLYNYISQEQLTDIINAIKEIL